MRHVPSALALAAALAASPALAQKSLDAAINGMRDLVTEPLGRWQADGQGRCDHQDLKDAVATAVRLAGTLNPQKYGPAAAIKSGTWALDVADAARQGGCRDVSRRMYDHVMRTYVGSGYAGLRDRARVGIDALR